MLAKRRRPLGRSKKAARYNANIASFCEITSSGTPRRSRRCDRSKASRATPANSLESLAMTAIRREDSVDFVRAQASVITAAGSRGLFSSLARRPNSSSTHFSFNGCHAAVLAFASAAYVGCRQGSPTRSSAPNSQQFVVVSGTFVVQKGFGDMRLFTVSRGAI